MNPSCDLCGLPLPAAPPRSDFDGETYRFCCTGCRQVFRMLMEASDSPNPADFRKTELFRTCQTMGIIPASEAELNEIRERENPSPSEPEPTPEDGAALDLNLRVDGMWCPACAWVIDAALRGSPGVRFAATDFSLDRLRCRYDPVRTSPREVIRRVERLGYRAAPPEEGGAIEKRRALIRFGVSALFTMNVMMLSIALYGGFFTPVSRTDILKLSIPIFLMACVPFFYGGAEIHRRALAGLRNAGFGMETLISAASSAAFFYSVFNLFQGSLHLYFDTATGLVTLTLLGKLLERGARDRVAGDIESFFSLQPGKARVVTPEWPRGRYVAAEALTVGDRFRVDAGETVPADGVVLEGAGTLDEAALTGESVPVPRRPGERLRAGTEVAEGGFLAKVEAVGESTTLGRMIAIMERTLGRRTAFEGRTDRLLRYFTPLILALAFGTGAAWLLAGRDAETALVRAITVMVISCPCALGVAIPLARVAGIAVAGKRGLLVREFSAFEAADRVDAVVFDKTGTLTEGRYRLREVHPAGDWDEESLLALAAGLEAGADGAIRAGAAAREIAPEPVGVTEETGWGRTGVWRGRIVRIGAPAWTTGSALPESLHPADSDSAICLSLDGELAGVFHLGDRIRDGAAETVAKLKSSGWPVALVSGDGTATVRSVAERLGIETARGSFLPDAKAEFVAGLQQEGRTVAVVGDGVNDAPALAQADLGVAVHSGGRLDREAAGVTLMRGEPTQFLDFLELARRVNRTISQNLICAFVYNLLAIPIAMSGLLTPLWAVTAMLLSSLTVIGNTLGLVRRSGRRRGWESKGTED
ncbi:MAG: heavy metal translocating P-type ATPase [Desulfococcaceae bacterium]